MHEPKADAARCGPADEQPATTAADVERWWLGRLQAGDPGASQALLKPHVPSLLALAHRHCRDLHWAEDLVQETLVRAFRALPSFRAESSVRTWLFRILVRLASEPRRFGRRSHDEPLDDARIPDHLDEPALQRAMVRELQDRIDEAMERLTTRQRTALHLRAVEAMDYAGIGAILGCSEVAARMHVLAARRHVLARVHEHLDP